jgi:hypothetical protein
MEGAAGATEIFAKNLVKTFKEDIHFVKSSETYERQYLRMSRRVHQQIFITKSGITKTFVFWDTKSKILLKEGGIQLKLKPPSY